MTEVPFNVEDEFNLKLEDTAVQLARFGDVVRYIENAIAGSRALRKVQSHRLREAPRRGHRHGCRIAPSGRARLQRSRPRARVAWESEQRADPIGGVRG